MHTMGTVKHKAVEMLKVKKNKINILEIYQAKGNHYYHVNFNMKYI